jgi:hypothetical protein
LAFLALMAFGRFDILYICTPGPAFGWFYILTVAHLWLSPLNNHCLKGGDASHWAEDWVIWRARHPPPLQRVIVVFSLVYQGEMIERGGKNLQDPIIASHVHIFELLSAIRHLLGCLLSNCQCSWLTSMIWRVRPSNIKIWPYIPSLGCIPSPSRVPVVKLPVLPGEQSYMKGNTFKFQHMAL